MWLCTCWLMTSVLCVGTACRTEPSQPRRSLRQDTEDWSFCQLLSSSTCLVSAPLSQSWMSHCFQKENSTVNQKASPPCSCRSQCTKSAKLCPATLNNNQPQTETNIIADRHWPSRVWGDTNYMTTPSGNEYDTQCLQPCLTTRTYRKVWWHNPKPPYGLEDAETKAVFEEPDSLWG